MKSFVRNSNKTRGKKNFRKSSRGKKHLRKSSRGKKHLRKSRRGKKGGDNFLEQVQKSKPSDEQRIHEAKKDIENQHKMMRNMEQGKYLNPEAGKLFVSSHPTKGFMADENYIPYNKFSRENPIHVQKRPTKPKRPYNPNEKSRELAEANMQRKITNDMKEAGGEMDYEDSVSFGGKKRKSRKNKRH